jgi:ribonucrease Y
MTAQFVALFSVVVVLVLLVAGGLVYGLRVLRRLQPVTPALPAEDDPAFLAQKDKQERSLAKLQTAAAEATSAVEEAKNETAAARTESAAARAEASSARAEARRVLDAAHAEADTILDRAHRQAESDAEQVRAAARRSGEREVALLNATVKEQGAEVERRAARIDERERQPRSWTG